MTWFESLTGVTEISPENVRENFQVDGTRVTSLANGCSWNWGELQIASLEELRKLASNAHNQNGRLSVRTITADVQQLHRDTANAGALFQVASQFNLLEMINQNRTPEQGIGIYEYDRTQGPACAIAAGAGTLYRNYFANVNGQVGQSAEQQIDCLAGIGELLDNTGQRLWQMKNGYALPSSAGLEEITRKLKSYREEERDRVRKALRIGIQWQTQVTLDGATHLVSQAYCSAMPVSYSELPSQLWADFASLILEAAYEATLCAAVINREKTGNRQLFLTLLGGGAFGNEIDWIINALRRAFSIFARADLDVAIVSYRSTNPAIAQLVDELHSR